MEQTYADASFCYELKWHPLPTYTELLLTVMHHIS